jgi:TatA/E family protein of Tat protein translocase
LFTGGFGEIGFILFIAFLLFGPKKLPEIARTLGKGMAELRRASNELRSSLEEEIKNLDRYPEGSSDLSSKYGSSELSPKNGSSSLSSQYGSSELTTKYVHNDSEPVPKEPGS